MSAEEALLTFADAAQWESWLAEHHDGGTGVWLKIAKKGSGVTSVTQPQALAACLCYGWIDSHRRSFDEKFYLQRYSRRRTGSPWSQVNGEQAEALVAGGPDAPPGVRGDRLRSGGRAVERRLPLPARRHRPAGSGRG